MELIKKGKTKDVYKSGNGNIVLKLKDDATGKDGVFDPGENSVGLSIEGLGRLSLRLSEYYFELMEAAGIETHFISSNLEASEMTVRPARIFGKGLEMICRLKAAGSFVRRYGDYINFGAPLDYFFEITLKNDSRQDPPISPEALTALGIMSAEEYGYCKELTVNATRVVEADLAKKGLQLYDIKFEFGRCDGGIILIDEISAGNLRVYRDGELIQPVELAEIILGE